MSAFLKCSTKSGIDNNKKIKKKENWTNFIIENEDQIVIIEICRTCQICFAAVSIVDFISR
jgi:CRISPR/Cas system-associated endoribonuclease Cas2